MAFLSNTLTKAKANHALCSIIRPTNHSCEGESPADPHKISSPNQRVHGLHYSSAQSFKKTRAPLGSIKQAESWAPSRMGLDDKHPPYPKH